MYPHQQLSRAESPDLALIYNADRLNAAVAELSVGDLLGFRATIIALGARSSPHLGVMWNVEKLMANEDLPSMYEEEGIDPSSLWSVKKLGRVAKQIRDAHRNFTGANYNIAGVDIHGAP